MLFLIGRYRGIIGISSREQAFGFFSRIFLIKKPLSI
jgi:hypothetical protein